MSDAGEAVEGAIAFIVGGFMLLLIGSAVESSSLLYNFSTFGLVMILLGIVLAVALVASLIGGLSGR
ncbi:hypothetical protein [Haloarcula sp. Atlit-120R]|jgi:hypothetical protein|uniref:hypothetical protein n=1 Tax=Haloarcula sp. Atlit-120R TaxID=2282135 RepID=UPI000EF24809|nr:hypothetical protein [Haloarcula sp. Atlit-120R]RLM33153.1 hypothetical protein DVK01_18350 [Haloarcula sp. Atlit-120R]